MDWITQCYYSTMRPYRDRPDIEVKGRWRWCAAGAKTIPYWHLFGSFTMDYGEKRIDPPVGEIPKKQGRSRGESNPRLNGQGWCGTQQDWEQGSLYAGHVPPLVDADGIPLCCPSASPPLGGLELDGDTDLGEASSAGGEMGGEGGSPGSSEYTADGGAECYGESPPPPREIRADGGIEGDGESPPPPREEESLVSSLEISGRGDIPPTRDTETEGGGIWSGRADKPLSTEIAPEGGLEVASGDGTKPVSRDITAEGGGEMGGDGSQPVLLLVEPEIGEGLEIGGEGETPLLSEVMSEGGLEVGPGATTPSELIVVECTDEPIPDTLEVLYHWLDSPVITD